LCDRDRRVGRLLEREPGPEVGAAGGGCCGRGDQVDIEHLAKYLPVEARDGDIVIRSS
jgi:hypothetical protein